MGANRIDWEMCPPNCDDKTDLRGGKPSIDAALDVLRNPLRRDVIDYCANTSSRTVDIEELADHVMRRREQSEESDREAIVATLHHKHIPILDEHGVIDYDSRSGQLRYWPDDRIEDWLARIRAEEPER